MIRFYRRLLFTSTLFMLVAPVFGEEVVRMPDHDPTVIEELRVRDGLPNIFKKLTAGEMVCVAYLGGSITHADGWRPKTFAWLQSQFPEAPLVQLNAAVPGTGADFAACRLAKDVLPHNPDLVFVEFRVNNGGGVEARAIEGVVRQLWQANPETDICLVYTLGEWMLEDLGDGKQYFFGKIMEIAANVYGIPSIDLAPEVMRRISEGTLVFKAPEPVEGKLHFSKDGVHPLDEGHQLYADVITRSLAAMMGQGTSSQHRMPPPMEKQHFGDASLIPISTVRLSEGWQAVDRETDELYNLDSFRTGEMLSNAFKSNREGASFTVEWTGTRLGMTHIPQGGGMEILVSTDGAEPTAYTLNQTDSANLYARCTYLKEHPQAKHTTTIRLHKLPHGSTFYAGQLLLLRDP